MSDYTYPHECGACGRIYHDHADGWHGYHHRLQAYVCFGSCMKNLFGEDVTHHCMSWFGLLPWVQESEGDCDG